MYYFYTVQGTNSYYSNITSTVACMMLATHWVVFKAEIFQCQTKFYLYSLFSRLDTSSHWWKPPVNINKISANDHTKEGCGLLSRITRRSLPTRWYLNGLLQQLRRRVNSHRLQNIFSFWSHFNTVLFSPAPYLQIIKYTTVEAIDTCLLQWKRKQKSIQQETRCRSDSALTLTSGMEMQFLSLMHQHCTFILAQPKTELRLNDWGWVFCFVLCVCVLLFVWGFLCLVLGFFFLNMGACCLDI